MLAMRGVAAWLRYADHVEPDVIAALKALNDPTRLRIVGRLAARPASNEQLAADLGLPARVVVRQVDLLRRSGVVGPPGRTPAPVLVLRIDTLHAIGRALAEHERASTGHRATDLGEHVTDDDARILRGYLEDGRLTAIPAQSGKRSVVLRWLLEQVFREEREYPEKEINQRLALFHPDVASLRRYLVDAGLATRDHGRYRRAPDAD